MSHHHGEDDGGGRDLDGPEDDEAGQLNHGEDVDLPQRDVAQVDQVRLVFGRHAEQFDPVEQLQDRRTHETSETLKHRLVTLQQDRQTLRHTWMPLSEDTPMYRKTPYRTGIGMNWNVKHLVSV